jgi:hypothetical protein
MNITYLSRFSYGLISSSLSSCMSKPSNVRLLPSVSTLDLRIIERDIYFYSLFSLFLLSISIFSFTISSCTIDSFSVLGFIVIDLFSYNTWISYPSIFGIFCSCYGSIMVSFNTFLFFYWVSLTYCNLAILKALLSSTI